MKSVAEIEHTVRERSPLPPHETDRLLRGSFSPTRTVQFLCREYSAHRLAVLDVGCGYGQHLIHFGPGSLGIDAVKSNVDFASALGLEAALVNVEDELPTFDRQFDAVYCSNIVEHLVAPHLLLLRLHRVLKPNGLIFIMVPTVPPNRALEWLIRKAIGHNGFRASEHIYAFTPRTAEFMVERAGYNVLESAFVAARGRRLGRLLEPVLKEVGISALVVGQRDPAFQYPEKRVQEFTPAYMSSLDARA